MEILPVTEETVYEGLALQRKLMDRGIPVDQLNALIVGAVRNEEPPSRLARNSSGVTR